MGKSDAVEHSQYNAELIHDIKNGNTGRQIRERFRKGLVLGVGQAGLMGLAGLASADHAKKEAADEANKRKAIANAYKRDAVRSVVDEEPSAPARPASPGVDMVSGADPAAHIKSIAENGMANDAVNRAAAGAPVTWGGQAQYTPAGLDDLQQNASVQGQDINTARGIMDSNPVTDFTPELSGLNKSRIR